ncbi:MAG: DUF1947 domain-containing protein [Candidatus Aenigmatarchaeota archaeon]
MDLKNRHRLKDKDVDKYFEHMQANLGDSPFEPGDGVDIADCNDRRVLLIDQEPLATFFDEEVFPTIQGLLKMDPSKRYVTVDMGAVKFVYNGADIMAPGIVDADESIEEGTMVWIRDEEHNKPLAVGRAMTHGAEMKKSEIGKVIKSLHHVGDGMFE